MKHTSWSEELKKEFSKKFVSEWVFAGNQKPMWKEVPSVREIWQFVEQALNSQKKQIIKHLKERKYEGQNVYLNEAITETIKYIKSL